VTLFRSHIYDRAAAVGASQDRSEVTVPCSMPALDDALASDTGGEVVVLADRCTYWLGSALPGPTTDLTIMGRRDTFRRTADSPNFTILTVDAGQPQHHRRELRQRRRLHGG